MPCVLLSLPRNHPARSVTQHPDVRIIRLRLRRSQQKQIRVHARRSMRWRHLPHKSFSTVTWIPSASNNTRRIGALPAGHLDQMRGITSNAMRAFRAARKRHRSRETQRQSPRSCVGRKCRWREKSHLERQKEGPVCVSYDPPINSASPRIRRAP